ncbi:unnamed protein product [Rotaria sordida]|uniref:Uncharacterized protein n=1 Tax=Rotaria sordida TaxID=392033 RepID=A0A814BCV2_9BILA|nr:unnamed protein product [Rotaria sordida]CAF0927695.1 unnamed protein product [Rotaria sordida]CAF0959602.1 unnamed protein product [Rotaria sordida]CAF0990181.1 unnamed protein product [Rotaria sordida]CAF3955584.1 unnamed protein product [Rotaria sordida]
MGLRYSKQNQKKSVGPIKDIKPTHPASKLPSTYVAASACYDDYGDIGGSCDDGECAGCGGGGGGGGCDD